MSNLRLQVILGVLDKASAPLKKLKQGSGQTGQSLEELKAKLAGLQKQSRLMESLKAGQEAFKNLRHNVAQANAKLQEMQAAGDVSESKLKKQQAAVEKLTNSYNRKKEAILKIGRELRRMSGGALDSNATLRRKIDETTEALNKQLQVQKKLDRYAKDHASALMRSGTIIAGGASAYYAGKRMGAGVTALTDKYANSEDASNQLKSSLMLSGGSVAPEFAQIDALARSLGGRLPGTNADFIEMMTVLRRQGLSVKSILGGTGEAAALLGVQLRMPLPAAAEFAAKMQDATQTVEGDMQGLMDMIQRTYYLGVDSGNMLQGFSKLAPVMSMMGKKGLEASNMLAPLLVMMDQTGMAGESAGNAIRKVVQAGFDAKKLKKTNAMLRRKGVKLDFTNGKGEFGGIENMFAQLKKLEKLSTVQRTQALKTLFGDDAETHQVLNTMIAKGIDGYKEVLAKMQAQADLQTRVDDSLGTLKNLSEAAGGAWDNVQTAIGETIAPDLKKLVKWLSLAGEKVGEWIKENPALTRGLVWAAVALAAVLTVGGALAVVLATLYAKMFLLRWGFAAMTSGFTRTLSLGGMLGKVFGWLRGVLGLLGGAFGRILPWVARLGGVFVWAKDVALWLARAFGFVFSKMTPLGWAFSMLATSAYVLYSRWEEVLEGGRLLFKDLGDDLVGTVKTLGSLLYEEFVNAGKLAMDGLIGGIKSGYEYVKNAVTSLADSVVGWWNDETETRSPSRVFIRLGKFLAEGLSVGLDRGQNMVRSSVAALAALTTTGFATAGLDINAPMPMIAPAAAAARGAPFMGGGSSYHITINAAPGMDAQTIAQAVRRELDARERQQRARILSQQHDME